MYKRIFGSVMALITAVAITGCSAGESVKTVTLGTSSLKNTVSSTGYIQSTDETNVYTSLNYTIKEVNVEVGDNVKAGDVLCMLDTTLLETQIVAAKTALDSNETNTDYSLSQAEKDYIKMKDEMESGTYQPIVLAERNVDYMKEALDIAQRAYDDKVKELADGSDLTIKAKKTALQLAESNVEISYDIFKNTYESHEAGEYIAKRYSEVKRTRKRYLADRSEEKRKEYDDAIKDMNEMTAVSSTILQAWQKLCGDIMICDNAQFEYELALSAGDDMTDKLKDALTNAQMNYDGAVTDLETAKREAQKGLDDLKSKLDNDKEVTTFEAEKKNLEKLEKDLADCTVKAETDGTVTAVYAKEGAAAGGVLFIIENTGDLEVLAKFKEYDIANIEVGMPVIVKSDATGLTEYEGVVTKIAPTAVKDGTSTDTKFEVNISVKSEGTKLRIGMKAKVEVILEEKNNVYVVPLDAVRYDDNDDAYIFVAVSDGKNYTADKVMVSTGTVTDREIEIYGTDLKDGMTVIADGSEKISQGTVVAVEISE